MSASEAALWADAAGRLVRRWRTLAERIEPYAPPAAVAYRQAADDLEDHLGPLPRRLKLLEALREDLVEAVRRAERDANAEWGDRR